MIKYIALKSSSVVKTLDLRVKKSYKLNAEVATFV